MIIEQSWSDLKDTVSDKGLFMQYEQLTKDYKIWASEDGTTYECYIPITTPAGTDQSDFEDNYKSDCNKPINQWAPDGKNVMMSTSRPIGTHTVFTTSGDKTDTPKEIGGGTPWVFNFSNSDNIVTDSITGTIPTNFKKKRIKSAFLDAIYIKEGTIYFFDAPEGCYVDLWVVAPNGEYYYKNDGTLTQASADTPIIHYVIKHRVRGSAPMGDELNTEAASTDPLPTNYELWVEVTTPDSDSTSCSHVEVEMYRERSVILE